MYDEYIWLEPLL